MQPGCAQAAGQTLAEEMRAAEVEAEFAQLITTHGHDGFLAEPEQLVPLIRNFIQPIAPQEETYP